MGECVSTALPAQAGIGPACATGPANRLGELDDLDDAAHIEDGIGETI